MEKKEGEKEEVLQELKRLQLLLPIKDELLKKEQ
jgi:hypothetical protein